MDAREYLNRKGVGVERDADRPNTLEEKAWERARGAGFKRPKSGTPHDWEDWERHHDDLAEGAETLEQKIDKDAHRSTQEQAAQVPARPASASVEHFTPPPVAASEQQHPQQPASEQVAAPTAGLALAYQALALLLPPLAVGLTQGGAKRVAIAAVLTVAGWLPGVAYAFWWLQRR
ncbi:YqaE/Pmp3 family membrane protein [Vreelandella profundi]|uniref:YqaE/Pmp3 family membrane protein n=1 Tax=Vreelandella profundi TaxID=2852117 RepID=UPI001EF08473|nr:YqaE/Pmp3 family membrane protein [Halomonas profundi]